MFDSTEKPRVYGLPPGADFAAEFAKGLLDRMSDHRPESLARVTVLVNTRRMQRRLKMLLSEGPARLLPRIILITDLGALNQTSTIAPPVSPLRRRLELALMVDKLLQTEPEIAPKSATVDLADSLASLMDEMQGEGVSPETILALDVSDQSGHWERSLKFLSIVREYTERMSGEWMDPEARTRQLALELTTTWSEQPPTDPIIVAGSTGSRATTAMIMSAVARLPQGAVVLPGFDFHLPDDVFARLNTEKLTPLGSQDHPQFRFAKLLDSFGLGKADIDRWTDADPRAERNALISLSLRPAPITDRWLIEGPSLGDLRERTKGLSLLEAPQPRDEALAIAVALREAVEHGKTAALITPDRTLGRRVAATLQRWNITPDDSAGRPLSLTAPGRYLRQVARMVGAEPDPVELIALLKNPLAVSSEKDRGPHLRMTRELELYFRRKAIVVVSPAVIEGFRDEQAPVEQGWCNWLSSWLDQVKKRPLSTLHDCLVRHIAAAESLAAGSRDGSGLLWEQTAGRDALALVKRFEAETDHSGHLPFSEYYRLFERMLSAASTRNHDNAHPDVMIWGTLEARVQGADLVILGGLNEGVWPEHPSPDPWLNRSLRRQAGLLLPERQVGLSAHDFQQAVAAKEVILSRAKRDADSETVPSRWLIRLTNLLDGLREQNGPQALGEMKAAGQRYVDLAKVLDEPVEKVEPEPRPAPAPPLRARPRDLTVTEIQKLIRDPYSIYARYMLRIRPLDPLRVTPNPRIRGDVFHKIIEEAFGLDADFADEVHAADRLRGIARKHLDRLPWPGIAAHWYGHLDSIADQLVWDEQSRRALGHPIALERKGAFDIPGTRFSIRGKADRIDLLKDGKLVIFDYKTGAPPTLEELRYFDRQLPIEAVMAEHGGFKEVPAAIVSHVTHIGLGRTPKVQETHLEIGDKLDLRTVTIQAELAQLLNSFDSEDKGYPSRRAMEKVRYEGDYDHLARFGEWDETKEPETVRLP